MLTQVRLDCADQDVVGDIVLNAGASFDLPKKVPPFTEGDE